MELQLSGAHTESAEASARQIQRDAGTLFGKCLQAFHAYGELGDLAENMRILSLNAELAAGRAGRQGETVRVLTQYTRELVNRLSAIQRQMLELKGRTYAYSADALRILHQLNSLDSALVTLRRKEAADEQARRRVQQGLDGVAGARTSYLSSILDNVEGMVAAAEKLSELAGQVTDVISQANSIGTNIAIEAATAGQHSHEFEHVAETMRTFVKHLRSMTEAAGQSVSEATKAGHALQGKARSHLSRGNGAGTASQEQHP